MVNVVEDFELPLVVNQDAPLVLSGILDGLALVEGSPDFGELQINHDDGQIEQ